MRKRDAIIVVLCIVSIFATSLGSILAANTLTLSLIFERTFTDIALLSGYFLMGTGVAAILCVPSGRVWGKRHLFLLGTILCTVGSAWAGASTGYKSFLWARIIQGMGTAPFETLVNAAVGDLYFVHVRSIVQTREPLYGLKLLTFDRNAVQEWPLPTWRSSEGHSLPLSW